MMKKLQRLLVSLVMLGCLSACTDQISSTETTGSSEKNNSARSSEELTKEAQHVVDLVQRADQISIGPLKATITDADKDSLAQLLKSADWSQGELPEAMGYTDEFIISSGETRHLIFINNNQVLAKTSKDEFMLHTIDAQTMQAAIQLANGVANRSIQDGNDAFLQEINKFDRLVIGEYANFYELAVDSPNIVPVNLDRLADALQVNSWTVYDGQEKEVYQELNLSDVVFAKEMESYFVPMAINQWEDLYTVHCTFFDGPGGTIIFEIPKNAYDQIVKIKNENAAPFETAVFQLGNDTNTQKLLRKNDTIGGWMVDRIHVAYSDDQINRVNAYFKGTVAVSGKITRDPFLEEGYVFAVAEEDADKIPRYMHPDTEFKDATMFMLTIPEELPNYPQLAFEEELSCTITISEYRDVFAYMMAPSSATVTEIVVR